MAGFSEQGTDFADAFIGCFRRQCGIWAAALATAFLAFAVHAGGNLSDSADPAQEYRAKAACFYKILFFVEWPDTKEEAGKAEEDLTTHVVGQDVCGDSLKRMEGATIGSKRKVLRVRRLGKYSEYLKFEDSEVVFICRSEAEHCEAILRCLKGKPVLTVADFPGFAQRGGMIELVQVEDKLRWRINHSAVKAVDLQISGQLLKNALEIISGPDTGSEQKGEKSYRPADNGSKKGPGP